MVRVFRVVTPVATVRFQVELEPEPMLEFRPVASTTDRNCEGTAPAEEYWHMARWMGEYRL